VRGDIMAPNEEYVNKLFCFNDAGELTHIEFEDGRRLTVEEYGKLYPTD
jgi:hypothetical protein